MLYPLFYPLTGAIEWCQDNTRLVWCFCYRNVSIYWPLISKQLSPLTQSFLCIPKHLVLYYDTGQPNDFKFPLRFSSAVCKIILTRTCLLITLMNQRVKLWRIKKELKIRRWWSLDIMTSRLILSHLFKPLECLSSKIYWKLLSDSPRLLVNPVFFYHSFPFAKTCNVDLQTTSSYQIVKSVIDVNNMYCILFTETVLARLPMAKQAMRWKSLCLVTNDTLNNEEIMSFISLNERNLG